MYRVHYLCCFSASGFPLDERNGGIVYGAQDFILMRGYGEEHSLFEHGLEISRLHHLVVRLLQILADLI